MWPFLEINTHVNIEMLFFELSKPIIALFYIYIYNKFAMETFSKKFYKKSYWKMN